MRRVVSGAVIVGLALASGCARERRLFDVVLDVTEAEALAGVLDRDDVVVLHEVIPDVGEGNGGDGLEQTITLALDPGATSVVFTLTVVDAADLSPLGVARSLATPLPATPQTLTVTALLAPATPGPLTTLPPAGGADVCVTDDGLGSHFIVGGTRSQQAAYLIDGVEVRTIAGAAYPAGVGRAGCGARLGLVAVAGGCSGDVDDTAAHLILPDGSREAFPTTAIEEPCGAAASPRGDDALWLVDGDQSLHRVTRTGTIDLGSLGAGARTGFEVNQDDAAVVLVGGALFYAGDTLTNLGPHVALGRRGQEVLVLDGDGVISVVENATTRALITGVDLTDVGGFVVLDDDTVVALRRDGATIDVRAPDGATRAIATTAPGTTRIAARPDGVIVLGGADVAGLLAVGLAR